MDCHGIEVFDDIKLKYHQNSEILEMALILEMKYFILDPDQLEEQQ